MALLDTIDYGGTTESMESMYAKLNIAIGVINSELGGGTTGQILKKTSSTDFAIEWGSVTLADTGWVSITADSPFISSAQSRKIGNIVYLRGSFNTTSEPSGTLGTLTAGYRPAIACVFAAIPSGIELNRVSIATSGQITFEATGDFNVLYLDGIQFIVD